MAYKSQGTSSGKWLKAAKANADLKIPGAQAGIVIVKHKGKETLGGEVSPPSTDFLVLDNTVLANQIATESVLLPPMMRSARRWPKE